MTERWLSVPGWEDLYSVSDQGRVKSEHRVIVQSNGIRRVVRERILQPAPDSHGHLHVVLYRGGRGTTVKVHLLVLASFVGPRPPGLDGLHWDDVPDNNALLNLRYGSPSENRHDQVRNGGHHQANKTHCVNGHAFTPENTIVRRNGNRDCRPCAYRRSAESYQRRKSTERKSA